MGIFNVGFNPNSKNNSSWIVISVGGSLIAPKGGIDTAFLKSFKKTIIDLVERKGMKFVIVCGGGKTARDYQTAYKAVNPNVSDYCLDFMGIYATQLNARLMVNIFKDVADQEIIENPNEDIFINNPIVVAGGWKPGCSTDYDAVLLALNVGARRIVNLSNIDGVYDGDPKKVVKVKRFREISWDNYLKLIPDKWTPGLSTPFDPVASKKAKEKGMEVFITNGNEIKNMESYLESGFFHSGTLIKEGVSSKFECFALSDRPIEYRMHKSGTICMYLPPNTISK